MTTLPAAFVRNRLAGETDGLLGYLVPLLWTGWTQVHEYNSAHEPPAKDNTM